MNTLLSVCCGAGIKTGSDDPDGLTKPMYYICLKCGEPCDAIAEQGRLSSCCCAVAVIYSSSPRRYVCSKCERLCGTHVGEPICLDCGTTGCDGKCTLHNDKSITRQCCACAHVTGEMVAVAESLKANIGTSSVTYPMQIAQLLAKLILETQKKDMTMVYACEVCGGEKS